MYSAQQTVWVRYCITQLCHKLDERGNPYHGWTFTHDVFQRSLLCETHGWIFTHKVHSENFTVIKSGVNFNHWARKMREQGRRCAVRPVLPAVRHHRASIFFWQWSHWFHLRCILLTTHQCSVSCKQTPQCSRVIGMRAGALYHSFWQSGTIQEREGSLDRAKLSLSSVSVSLSLSHTYTHTHAD